MEIDLSGFKALALGVIQQAVVDARSEPPRRPFESKFPKVRRYKDADGNDVVKITTFKQAFVKYLWEYEQWEITQWEAVNFLTSEAGGDAESFDLWCYAAGISSEWARMKMKSMLAPRIQAAQ